jgi:outer membrane lipoprotein-sorting protein
LKKDQSDFKDLANQSKMRVTIFAIFLLLLIITFGSAQDGAETLETRLAEISQELDSKMSAIQQSTQILGEDNVETLCYYCFMYTDVPSMYFYTPGQEPQYYWK